MSLSKGNVSRTRPQKHQNKSAFKNNLHDTSKKTKTLNSLEVSGVCTRCKDIIEWKIKYKKYKPLSTPGKCVVCNEKAVRHAYHVLCTKCATDKAVCAKCQRSKENQQILEPDNLNDNENEIQAKLKNLPERKRRTILRHINKLKKDEQVVSMAILEKMIIDLDKLNFDEDLDNISDADVEDDDCLSC